MLEKLPPPPQGREGWPWTEAAPPLPERAPDGSAWPRVTVVTPSYNQAAFIEETIRSVLLQGYSNLEYIIVDGGSTDGSADIIARYADHLAWWVSEPDDGQSDAINKGFRRATGEIVAWLNSDDVYVPGALAESAGYLAQHPEIDVVYGDVSVVNAKNTFIAVLSSQKVDLRVMIEDGYCLPQPTAFIRREWVERVGLLDTDRHYTMDRDWYIRMLLAGAHFAHLPGERVAVRMHEGAKTVKHQPRFQAEHDRILDAFFARPDLTAEQRTWRHRAYANSAIKRGSALRRAGEKRAALDALWQGIRLDPYRARNILVLLLMFDALTGLHTWNAITRIKRRLQGQEPDLWDQI